MTEPAPAGAPEAAPEPVFSVVAGRPTAEELAAVTVVLSARARSGGEARPPGPVRREWSARSRLVREPLSRGPAGWRASALPR